MEAEYGAQAPTMGTLWSSDPSLPSWGWAVPHMTTIVNQDYSFSGGAPVSSYSFSNIPIGPASSYTFTSRIVLPLYAAEAPAPAAPTYPDVPDKPEPVLGEADHVPDESVCQVCMERRRNTVVLPCGHVYACVTCMATQRPAKCGGCNGQVERVVKTFIS